MVHLILEWNDAKSTSNEKKHGITFEEAKSAFIDQFTRLISDPAHSNDDEDRFILLGASIHSRLLVVCHCPRENETIRIISARKADKQERTTYEGYRHA